VPVRNVDTQSCLFGLVGWFSLGQSCLSGLVGWFCHCWSFGRGTDCVVRPPGPGIPILQLVYGVDSGQTVFFCVAALMR
jgi:hypothetical protein